MHLENYIMYVKRNEKTNKGNEGIRYRKSKVRNQRFGSESGRTEGTGWDDRHRKYDRDS